MTSLFEEVRAGINNDLDGVAELNGQISALRVQLLELVQATRDRIDTTSHEALIQETERLFGAAGAIRRGCDDVTAAVAEARDAVHIWIR